MNDRVEAEDATQEACITMYRTIAELRSAAAFRVWFYRIVVREAAARKRKQARQVKAVVAIPDPVDETALIDVWNALATLPDSLRSVVVLRYFEDLSSREIASVLRIPDGTVRALMLSYDLPGAGRRSNHLLTVVLANPAAYTAKPNDTRSKPVPHSDDVMITERVSEQWTVGGEVVLLLPPSTMTVAEIAHMKRAMNAHSRLP